MGQSDPLLRGGGLSVQSGDIAVVGNNGAGKKLSWYQRVFPVLINASERKTAWDFVRATVAIHCSIMFWVGSWNILSPVSKFKGLNQCFNVTNSHGRSHKVCNNTANVEPLLDIPNEWYTFFIYTTVGFFLLLFTDTLYGNAGSYGQWYSDRMLASKRLFFARLPCAIIGQLLLWIGMYDIFDLTIDRNPDSQIYIDFAFIACGLGMLVGTNTLVWCANIYPDESVFDNDVTPDHSRWEHVKFTLKVVVSMMSQNCLWLGMYDLLENYYSGGSLGYWREFTWVGSGAVLMSFSGSYMAASWIEFEEEEEEDEDEDEEDAKDGEAGLGGDAGDDYHATARGETSREEEEKDEEAEEEEQGDARPVGSWFFTAKMLIAYFGSVMHNTGIWTLLDQYIPNSSFRSVAYIGIGVTGMVLAGSFLANFALVWPSDEEDAASEAAGGGGSIDGPAPASQMLLPAARSEAAGSPEEFDKLISSAPSSPTRSSSPSKSRSSAASAGYFGRGSVDAVYEA